MVAKVRFVVSLPLLWALAAAQGKPDPEDPGPPVLKRGGTVKRRPPDTRLPPLARSPEIEPESADADPAATVPMDLVARARVIAADFTSELPNFVCDQLTTRSESSSRKPNWKKKDQVEVELMYVDGKEDYRNVRINGKPLRKGTPEDTGQWSTGDFGTTLVDVLSPSSAAEFTKRGQDRVADLEAVVYDFSVRQANSHWVIQYGGNLKPAYTGSLWIDPESARVLRIEMQARQMPATHLLDTVEMTVEYGWVPIAGQRYLLPVKSSNLACFRGTNNCAKNDIEFRNYRRFSTESSISTTESSVSFEGETKPEAKPEPKPGKP